MLEVARVINELIVKQLKLCLVCGKSSVNADVMIDGDL